MTADAITNNHQQCPRIIKYQNTGNFHSVAISNMVPLPFQPSCLRRISTKILLQAEHGSFTYHLPFCLCRFSTKFLLQAEQYLETHIDPNLEHVGFVPGSAVEFVPRSTGSKIQDARCSSEEPKYHPRPKSLIPAECS